MLSEILNEARVSRRMRFWKTWVNTLHSLRRACSSTSLRERAVVYTEAQTRQKSLCVFRTCVNHYTQRNVKRSDLPCTALSSCFTLHLPVNVCVMWFIPLVIALVAQASCQCSVVTDLFTFVGWQEHEISSGCTAAGQPANSMALQVPRCSRYTLSRPPTRPPSLWTTRDVSDPTFTQRAQCSARKPAVTETNMVLMFTKPTCFGCSTYGSYMNASGS